MSKVYLEDSIGNAIRGKTGEEKERQLRKLMLELYPPKEV